MTVSPRDLLREARYAAHRKDEETARRTAISRAYYAAFHAARKYHTRLPKPGRSKANVGDHENLIHQLRNPDPSLPDELRKKSTVVGTLLLKLRPSRMLADYELEDEVLGRAVDDSIDLAAQILNLTDPK